MLAEIEHFDSLVVVYDTSGIVDVLVAARKFGQKTDVVFQVVGVTVELGLQHFQGGQRIGFGRVGFGQVFLAVEFVCGDQRALFHLVENVLHVDETAFFQVDVYTGSQELFDQHRDVELVGIVSGQVASFDVAPQRFGDHLESRTVGYVLVVDMVDGRCRFGNVHLRVQPPGFGFLAAVGHYFCERYFDDPVFGGIDSGRFEVEEDDRIFQIQFHGVRVVFRVSGTYK